MEKIKSILNPGKAQDDETLYGSGQTSGTTGGTTTGTTTGNTSDLSGEGSHFGNTRDTTTGNTTGLTGAQTSGVTSTGAGVGNTQNTGLSGTNTTAGPHSSNLANKADPRVDSDLDGSRKIGNSGATGYNTTGTSAGTTGNSGHHLGHDAAAVGTAGTVGEGIHHHRENERANPGTSNTGYTGSNTTGTNTGYTESNTSGTNTGYTGNNPTGTTTSNHHIGRDAAAVGTAGAVGEGIHHHRENERDNLGASSAGYTGTGTTGAYHGGPSGSELGPHSTDTANRLDPAVNTRGTGGLEDAHHHSATHGGGAKAADQHHLGRDAAVGAGGVGLTEHEHHKHQNEREGYGTGATSGLGPSSTTGAYDNTTGSSGHHLGRDAAVGAGGVGSAGLASALPGPAPNTAGPHKHDWLNKLDPRVNANPNVSQSTGSAGPFTADAGPAVAGSHGGPSNLGRDTAGAGVVGAGAYEAEKHHHNKEERELGQPGASGITGQSTTGPHSSNIADRTVDSDRSRDHHYGRDAAAAGGVGGAAYEADKHHKHDKDLTAAEREQKREQKHEVKEERKHDHHHGRDAAVAGGVGGAAYEADKHHKHDKDLTAAEREQKREHKHELKEEKREHQEEKKGGLLSFLHRDKSKKYTPEEEAEFDRQEREHNSHHGRDAALGGAAVGAGAYEADKHHHGHHNTSTLDDANTNKPLPVAPGNHGIGTGAGTQNALAGNNSTATGNSNLGRDAALAGGAGAVGVHEHDKHHQAGTVPLAEKPRGTDLGDKLHGVARNRGVAGSTGFPEGHEHGVSQAGTAGTTGTGHHLGRDAAVGAGGVGLAEHEHRKHDGTSSGLTGSSQGYGNTSETATDHHLGRDAAVGAGGVGLAEHEHKKHEGVDSTGQYDNKTSGSGLTGSHQGQHHLGRDAAFDTGGAGFAEHENHKHEGTGIQQNQYDSIPSGAGGTGTGHRDHHLGRDAAVGAGGVGLAEHEHRKYEGTTSGVTGSNQGQTGDHYGRDAVGPGATGEVGAHEYRKHDNTTGQSTGLTGSGVGTGGSGPTTGDDTNRLHKDPPAGHPAAQAYAQQQQGVNRGTGETHVPESKTERERIVGQGEQSLEDDTGVANSHAQGGVNSASNY